MKRKVARRPRKPSNCRPESATPTNHASDSASCNSILIFESIYRRKIRSLLLFRFLEIGSRTLLSFRFRVQNPVDLQASINALFRVGVQIKMTIIVYGLAMSTCTARVLATLFEKEVDDYVLKPVDLANQAHKKPEYLALQPFGVIPVIQDGDLTLFESRAIARYIADKYADQGTPLYGHSLKDRAKVEQWLEVDSHDFHPPISTVVFQLVFVHYKGLTTDESVVEANLAKLNTVLDVYEEHLSRNKYLAGDFFSLADLSHLPYLHFLINVAKKADVVKSKKHVYAWWESISSRPAWKKVLDLAAAKQ